MASTTVAPGSRPAGMPAESNLDQVAPELSLLARLAPRPGMVCRKAPRCARAPVAGQAAAAKRAAQAVGGWGSGGRGARGAAARCGCWSPRGRRGQAARPWWRHRPGGAGSGRPKQRAKLLRSFIFVLFQLAHPPPRPIDADPGGRGPQDINPTRLLRGVPKLNSIVGSVPYHGIQAYGMVPPSTGPNFVYE